VPLERVDAAVQGAELLDKVVVQRIWVCHGNP
jgi:hypothetical protein